MMEIDLPCQQCWEKKQKEGGDIFDVITTHEVDEDYVATCEVCSCEQDVEMI